MSTVNKHGHLNPNDPAYYAPRWLRERSEAQRSPSRETSFGEPRRPISAPASFDASLEDAFPRSLQRSLEPEAIPEPPGLVRELDRRIALVGVVRRLGLVVGVSALVALLFVIMVPTSRDSAQPSDSGASSSSGILQSIRSAFSQSAQSGADTQPALSQFQPATPALAGTSEPVTIREQPDGLLQQFLQWRQNPDSTVPSQ